MSEPAEPSEGATDTRCVLVCRDCSNDEFLALMPFSSPAKRGQWAAQHTRGTGHASWFCADGWPRPAEVRVLMRRDLEVSSD